MKHRFLYIMALLLTVATGAWAQDPDPIDLTPSADGTVWTLSTMPEYDVELEVTYYTDEEVAEMEEAAYTAGVDLTPSADGKTWTLAATPAFDVELEVEYETELALSETTDNSAALTEWDGYEANITLQRKLIAGSLIAGSWNTLAVPFNVSSQMLYYLTSTYGMQVKELTGTSLENDGKTLMLNFTDAQTIEAGKPYLVKVTSDFDFSAQALPGIVVSKDPVPVETTYVDFIPTLGKTTIQDVDADDVLFVAADNKLKNPSTIPTDMKGFRAYFLLKNLPAAARAFALNIDGEITGIDATLVNSEKVNSDVYDLQGRKVNAAQKGVYIVDGKKLVIK